jgi:hypothetical protein
MSQLPAKIRILASNVPLYPSESVDGVPIIFLTDSDEGEITPASNGFVGFKHLDGRTGFLRSDVRIFRIQERTVNIRLSECAFIHVTGASLPGRKLEAETESAPKLFSASDKNRIPRACAFAQYPENTGPSVIRCRLPQEISVFFFPKWAESCPFHCFEIAGDATV